MKKEIRTKPGKVKTQYSSYMTAEDAMKKIKRKAFSR